MSRWWGAMFSDRADAGRRLAGELTRFRGPDLVVLGLPRGGVPVAFEVARELQAPLDVIVVRKVGVPFQPELAMGAVGEDGVVVVNDHVLAMAGVERAEFEQVERRERAELERRAQRFRGDRPRLDLAGRTVVIVDDGIATGSTARAACAVARAHGARHVVLAAPVAAPSAVEALRREADELVLLETPERFSAVGQFYGDFRPTEDDEVLDLLSRSRHVPAGPAARPATRPDAPPDARTPAADPPLRDDEVEVAAGRVHLAGHLTLPAHPLGVVVFAHGSGSSRHSPRNQYVARVLQEAGLGTLLFDLLTPQEEAHRANVFDIDLLAERLHTVTEWVRTRPECRTLPIGYFGASTGAAAALGAAARAGGAIAAVVSRGGRPDLAGDRLPEVQAPTLLIVGGHDDVVLSLNEAAQARLTCTNRLAVVPGATHLFEEPGTLEAAAGLARDWFVAHLSRAAQPSG
jgi:putative phosphoribosyl transferase